MDREHLSSVIARFKREGHSAAQVDARQQLILALVLVAVGCLLIVAAAVGLVLSLRGLVQSGVANLRPSRYVKPAVDRRYLEWLSVKKHRA